MQKTICLTFDVEDYFQVENLREHFPLESWKLQELRVEDNVGQILDLLDHYGIEATFFMLGWIAERVPSLVSEIARRGHEIASHGYSHRLNFPRFFSEDDLREDLCCSRQLLKDITGIEVMGYRAPGFSVSEGLLFLLKDLGFAYDSSYNPFSLNSRYGRLSKNCGSSPFIHDSGIYEMPIPLAKIFHRQVPIGGGGYFRVFPLSVYKRMVRKYLVSNDVFLFYLHPWEIDSGQPRVKRLRWRYAFRHYVGIKDTLNKLDQFIKNFQEEANVVFCTVAEFLKCGKRSFKVP